MIVQPRFIQQSELPAYGLPDVGQEPSILTYIEKSSTLIDQHLGRQNTDGIGSIVWTTYTERKLLPSGRNLVRLNYKPLSAVSAATFASYPASGTNLTSANTSTAADGVTLSPLVSAQGRYGYGRRNQQQVYPDLNYGSNILQIASYFGGPPQFTAIDVSKVDFDPRTGECWIPAGLYLAAYTEIQVVYNSGFAPDALPHPIKQATAAIVFNYLTRPATGLTSFGAGQLHHQFTDSLLDSTIEEMLEPWVNVVAV